ncbi:MAG: aldehyde dehydrogenase family protein, partial [Burkholderiaceae bacterium]|nr:aldehyde dehydrogenase family protein [Burkholderiaceae bacterium]
SHVTTAGTFVPPTVLEIRSLEELTQEVFGPVLHVIRYKRADLPKLIDQINGSGFGLTLGVHSRIDETIDYITSRAHVGNIYVNRNIVGAVVGVQPFGGEGKSGTGPKAGGPLYLKRLQRDAHVAENRQPNSSPALDALTAWASSHGHDHLAHLAEAYGRNSLLNQLTVLPGPTGERNTLALVARGAIVCAAATQGALLNQLAATLATGNIALLAGATAQLLPADLPTAVKDRIQIIAQPDDFDAEFQIALVESALTGTLRTRLAAREGALVGLVETDACGAIPLWRLLAERALCVNTTAAGGNASLMTLDA